MESNENITVVLIVGCVREIIDPIGSSEGAREHSFQEIYEMLSFRRKYM